MKELKRRGMTPTSVVEEGQRGAYELGEKEMEESMEEDMDQSKRGKRNGVISMEFDKGTVNQRERSMALNSEGLEGLIPRAKLLVATGATFFLGFWPLILITFASFASLYLYFGQSFVHDASKMSISAPPYVDPYELLEDERISQIAPQFD
ncbi:uncharacterized protein A4U43_C03F24000 [Asparagus officinalis]|uniref:Tubulin alpha chain n=1 Tax=Asparagus officinalis TaxID=4686 RepID=A0A5P1FGU5_ASPOF|nr:uncharacterized protein LOC109834307 [Asparagus officinalis]ONK76109.1 uncharacterized protein A4U43_C03F24000 [Asparagus officinalis]